MANIFEKYGIKEVADVVMYEIEQDGSFGAPVLYFDSLKVSTIEQSAEEAEARGGKGNAPLIIWDFGKEITVNIEDALFSMKSLQYLYGADTIIDDEDEEGRVFIEKTITFVADENREIPTEWLAPTGIIYDISEATDQRVYLNGNLLDLEGNDELEEDTEYTYYFKLPVVGQRIRIYHDKFPGTYAFVGDTYARSYRTGKDEFFQFVIPKAKIQSEVTLEMTTDGDPSTFSMNLRVLRPKDGIMLKLIKYSL